MKNQPTDTTVEERELVPVVLLAGELGESVQTLADRLRDELERDDLGFRCVSAATAQRLIAHRDDWAAEFKRRQAEWQRRHKEADAKRPKIRGGIPAPAGAPLDSALAVLKSAENDRDWLYGRGEFTGGQR